MTNSPALFDARTHFWDRTQRHDILILAQRPELDRSRLPSEYAELREEIGIGDALVDQSARSEAETAWLLEVSAPLDWVAGVFGWIDVESGASLDRVLALPGAGKLVGFRLMLNRAASDDWIVGPAVVSGLRRVAERGLCCELLALPRHLAAVARALDGAPELRVVLSHAGMPPDPEDRAWVAWRDDIAALARRPTVATKFSGLREAAGAALESDALTATAEHLVASFGAQRLLFATNWPVIDLYGGAADWTRTARTLLDRLALSAGDRDAIFRTNAEAFVASCRRSGAKT